MKASMFVLQGTQMENASLICPLQIFQDGKVGMVWTQWIFLFKKNIILKMLLYILKN